MFCQDIYKNFITNKIAPGEKASSSIGNMYSASLYADVTETPMEVRVHMEAVLFQEKIPLKLIEVVHMQQDILQKI